MAKKPSQPTTTPPFSERAVMPVPVFRKRNLMSKSAYVRKRKAQLRGDPGSENLLPPIIEIASNKHGVRYCDEERWQKQQMLNVVEAR
jgi:hypothetical protein